MHSCLQCNFVHYLLLRTLTSFWCQCGRSFCISWNSAANNKIFFKPFTCLSEMQMRPIIICRKLECDGGRHRQQQVYPTVSSPKLNCTQPDCSLLLCTEIAAAPNCATGLQPFCQQWVHWNPIQGCDSAFVPAGNRPPWMQTTLQVHYFQLLFVSWFHMWENIHCPQYMLSWTMYMVCELCVGHMVIWSWLS